MYSGKDYDVAGMAVGAFPLTLFDDTSTKSKARCPVAEGDVVLALTSSGLQHHDFELLESILMAGNLSLDRLHGLNGGTSLGMFTCFQFKDKQPKTFHYYNF